MIPINQMNTMEMAKIGARIAVALKRAGLSQRALARRPISPTTLSRIISGDRQAKLPEVVAIA